MQIDTLAVRLRPRTGMEAADLGVRLCQHAARQVYTCYAVVALPVMLLALATFEIATWLPGLLLWWSKPWLDRTVLFVLSRAAFGQPTRPADVWRARRTTWWRQFFFTWTIRRLSFWRALTQPVYQLEGFSFWNAGPRLRQLRQGAAGVALVVTAAFSLAETALTLSLASLVFWLAPGGQMPDLGALVTGELSRSFSFFTAVSYAAVLLFLEPFYVGAGFGLYLNRRAELEAWDVEQELRRAFAA